MEGRSSRSVRRLGVALGLALVLLAATVPAARAAAAKLRVPYTTFTLPNGLQVILHEDHSLPIVSVNTWYRVGSGDEKPGRTGFAHLFEHIMFMGSENVPTGDFDRLLEAAGADNNGSTTPDRTNYFEDGPANALPLMLFLDSDRMGFLVSEMTPEKVDLQRGVVQNERRQSYENRPYGLADENILRRLYPAGHPYSWPVIGSMADLSAASLEDVKTFFRTYYTPNNAVLVDRRGHRRRPRRAGWSSAGSAPSRAAPRCSARPPAPFALAADVHGTLEDRVQLPRLYDSWHTQKAFAPDDAALSAAAQVLAGGKASRLYQRLVYELEIASDVYAYQDGGRLDGEFRVVATARPGHGARRAAAGGRPGRSRASPRSGPTARELERVVNGVEAQFLDNMQQVGGFGGKADQLNQYDYFTGTPDYFEQDLDRYRSLTAGRPAARRAAVPRRRAQGRAQRGAAGQDGAGRERREEAVRANPIRVVRLVRGGRPARPGRDRRDGGPGRPRPREAAGPGAAARRCACRPCRCRPCRTACSSRWSRCTRSRSWTSACWCAPGRRATRRTCPGSPPSRPACSTRAPAGAARSRSPSRWTTSARRWAPGPASRRATLWLHAHQGAVGRRRST